MPHMTVELLKSQTRIDILHVAYKGAAPAIADTIDGWPRVRPGSAARAMLCPPGVCSWIRQDDGMLAR